MEVIVAKTAGFCFGVKRAVDQGHSVIFLYDCISGQSQENEQAIRKLAESFAPLHTLVMSSEEYIR